MIVTGIETEKGGAETEIGVREESVPIEEIVTGIGIEETVENVIVESEVTEVTDTNPIGGIEESVDLKERCTSVPAVVVDEEVMRTI